MHTLSPFKSNQQLSIGVELELQLVNLQHFNLSMEATDLLRRIDEIAHSGELKPEITQSMIEINSSIHPSYTSLLKELRKLRNLLVNEARQTHIGICGGGTHPFQRWSEQRIFHTERFDKLSVQYGYLAKQFTIFGQHIHIGCQSGDDALYLCHAMAPYIPHFIPLSAASPFSQGVDTFFDCSRLAVITAFPMSGFPPWHLTWEEFSGYFEKMYRLGVVKTMKDFYWDIRPKPEFGTVEIRICDTPLTVDKAAEIAAYAQLLARWLLDQRKPLTQDVYLTYLINRFRVSRYGLDAMILDPINETQIPLVDEMLKTCNHIEAYAKELDCIEAFTNIRNDVLNRHNGARWLREHYRQYQSLNDVVRAQTQLWMKE